MSESITDAMEITPRLDLTAQLASIKTTQGQIYKILDIKADLDIFVNWYDGNVPWE